MRGINLDQLRAFIEVVRSGSFTAAAKELSLSQPAITHQVHELEHRFNVTLVERLGKRAYATEAGEKLLEHARAFLEEDERTANEMRRFADGWLGRVRIGTSMTVLIYLLPPLLRSLKTKYPRLEISLKAGLTSDTLERLKENELDFGLCAAPISDPSFETASLFEDELVAIFPKGARLVPKRVTPEIVSSFPLILGNKHSALRRSTAEWLGPFAHAPKPIMEFDNVEAIKSLVSVGLGASIVPSVCLTAARGLVHNIVVSRLSPRATRKIELVRVRGKRETAGMKLVADALIALRAPPLG